MSDKDFFIELQGEFLSEAIFMLEQYEESMLGLETGVDSEKHLTSIFRVAHSIKGGSAAVGFADLGKFAHKVEDLLAILRVSPTLVSSKIISILLKSGDEFKNRLLALRDKSEQPWDPSALLAEVLEETNRLNGAVSAESTPHSTSDAVSMTAPAQEPVPVFSLSVPKPESEIKPDPIPDPTFAISSLKKLVVEEDNSFIVFDSPAQIFPLNEEKRSDTTPAATTPAATTPAATTPASAAKSVEAAKGTKNTSITSIKVDLARLDSVLDAVGEIVVLKNQLVHDDAVKNGENIRLISVVDQLDKSVRELYEKTLGMRMTPLKSLFLKIQRIVRDVSLQLDKPLILNLLGEETEVERTVFEILGDPMVHLIRNALDHGIESQAVRKERGKNPTASLTVSAKQVGGQVVIEITDDGGGINREKVLAKAIEKNIVPAGTLASSMSNDQIFQLLFVPGFSTAEKLTDLSGRGVGLDVVKSNLDRVRGKIEIESTPLKGSTFKLNIPLSTSITDGIVVSIQQQKFILPIHAIKELVRIPPSLFTQVSTSQKVATVRDKLIPVADLSYLFKTLQSMPSQKISEQDIQMGVGSPEELMLAIVETPVGLIAFPVEQVLGQTQAVVKSLQIGQDIPEILGAAVLGDGGTVLILDPVTIVLRNRPQHQEVMAAA